MNQGAAAFFGGAGEDAFEEADGPRVYVPGELAARHAPAVSILMFLHHLWGRAAYE